MTSTGKKSKREAEVSRGMFVNIKYPGEKQTSEV